MTTVIDQERLILVGGCERSGTTLLAQLLDRHPLVACAPDVKFLNSAWLYHSFPRFREMLPIAVRRGMPIAGFQNFQRLFRVLDHCGLSEAEIMQWAQEARDGREFIQRFVRHYLRIRNKQRFAEKTPSNVYCFRDFLGMFPAGVVIHIIRDGRDVFCSLRRSGGHSGFRAASQWLYDTTAGIALRGSPRYLEVRYEELVRAPEAVLQQVCQHIDVEYSQTMLDTSKSQWFGKTEKWRQAPTGTITEQSIGSYQKEMSPADLGIFWNTMLTQEGASGAGSSYPWGARQLMEDLGYGGPDPHLGGPSFLDRSRAYWDSAKLNGHILKSQSRLALSYRPWRSPLTAL